MKNTKKILSFLLLLLPLGLLILLFSQKSNLDNYLSKSLISQTSEETKNRIQKQIDSLYNYQSNGNIYEITFIEFGSKGCIACKRMELVMETIKKKYTNKVNVVFLNILIPDNQELMKFFGISSIPTQVLLDKEAKEIYRHTGYCSDSELEIHF